MSTIKGKFLTLEGAECTGKSTIAPMVVARLKERGYQVIHTREPGGSPLAEEIRTAVLKDGNVGGITEALLFWAARSDHVEKTIQPALDKGWIVVCERFVDSSYAFQGAGRDLLTETRELERMVVGGFQPDYTLFFDIPFEEQKRRLSLRKAAADRIEKQGFEFYEKVFNAYQKRLIENPHRMVRIDALPDEITVQQSTLNWVNATFENLN